MENSEKIIGDEFLREKLEVSGKVEFMTGAEIKEIKGGDFMEKIIYLDKKSSRTERIGGPRIICECRLGAGDWLFEKFCKTKRLWGNSH